MIEIQDLCVEFGAVKAIDNLQATLHAPVCGLIGPNGAGKTTLVNALSGFARIAKGTIRVNGTDLSPLSTAQRVRLGLRRSFQTEQVVEDLTVWANVLAILDHVPHKRGDVLAMVSAALAHVGLTDLAAVPGRELNLFQRRMVEIAKSLVGQPQLILFDEPGAGLNEHESGILRETIVAIPKRFGAQVLLIDHDVDLIAATCTQTLVMDFGRRIALGATREVLEDSVVRRAYLGT